jgi:hypothetical protein
MDDAISAHSAGDDEATDTEEPDIAELASTLTEKKESIATIIDLCKDMREGKVYTVCLCV